MGLDSFVIPPFIEGFIIFLMVEIFIGLLTNCFIVIVNFRDWQRGQSLNSSDQLVVSLAISNTFFTCANAVSVVCSMFFTDVFLRNYVFYLLYFIMSYTIFSTSWLSAWLCLFFCVKIINFQNGCLAWLKSRVTVVVPWLILVSQVFSFFSCLPIFFTFTKMFAPNSTTETGANQTSNVVTGYQLNALYNYFTLLLNCFVPFLIVMTTTGRIIASLCSHAYHMKQSMEDDNGPSMKAHQGAARTMLSLLILYLIFYVVELSISFLSMGNPMYWVCFIIILSFPTIQSFILISGNAKLKQICLKQLRNCRKKQ